MRPYNRSLDEEDYSFLTRHVAALRVHLFHMEQNKIPHREWHPHRFWEYASILQQLEELNVPYDAEMVDIGAGASFFDPMLAMRYPRLVCVDNMKYGDISSMVFEQRDAYNVDLPLHACDMEKMTPFQDEQFGVTMCISSIEHVDDHEAAFHEMVRVTEAGGLIFVTSDYFRDAEHFEQSVSRHLQVTPYSEGYVNELVNRFPIEFVGDTDLAYRGDFVHNYSFVNLCFRKR